MARVHKTKERCKSCSGSGGYFADHIPGVPCFICRGRGYTGTGVYPEGARGARNLWAIRYDREARERDAAEFARKLEAAANG